MGVLSGTVFAGVLGYQTLAMGKSNGAGAVLARGRAQGRHGRPVTVILVQSKQTD